MEFGPHLDLATFAPSYGFLRPGLLSRGVSVCLCTIWCMKTQFTFVFTVFLEAISEIGRASCRERV